MILLITTLIALALGSALANEFKPTETLNAATFPVEWLQAQNRDVFKRLKSVIREGYNGMPETLWIENTVRNNQSAYQFVSQVGQNQANTGVLTRQLDFNDVMIVTALQFGIYEADTTKPGYVKENLQFFPLTDYFTANAGFTPADLFQLYQGGLQIKIGTNVVAENIALIDALYIPDTQEGNSATTEYSGTQIGAGIIPLFSHIIFDGSQNNIISLTAPTFNGIEWEQTAADTEVRIVLRPTGVKIKGAAGVKGNMVGTIQELLGA
jgi:hypothetical protein